MPVHQTPTSRKWYKSMNAGLYKAMLGLKDFNFHSVPVEVLEAVVCFALCGPSVVLDEPAWVFVCLTYRFLYS